MKKKIFFCWQSDTPDNKEFIQQCLQEVIADLDAHNPTYELENDNADNLFGAVDINSEIIQKIQEADIFIADTSIINTKDTIGRKTSNPNVMFETGFASACLGFKRMILLSNKETNTIESLSFDINHNRHIPFSTVGDNSKFKKNLYDEIGLIIKNDPPRPFLRNDDKSRISDLKYLTDLMSLVNIPLLKEFCDGLPIKICNNDILTYWAGFNAYYRCYRLDENIYDKDLQNILQPFHSSWERTLSYGHRFFDDKFQIFEFDRESAIADQKQLENDAIELQSNLDALMHYLHEHYHEIDLKETSSRAVQSIKDLFSANKPL